MTATMPQSQSNTRETPPALREWSPPMQVALPGGGESAGLPAIEAEGRRTLYGLHDEIVTPTMTAYERARKADDLNDQGRLKIVRAACADVVPVVETAKGVTERMAAQVRTWGVQLLAKVVGGPDAREIRDRWPRKPEDQVARAARLIQQVREGTPDRAKAIRILSAVHPIGDPAVTAGDTAGLLPAAYVPIAEAMILAAADAELYETRSRLATLTALLEREIASAEGFLRKVSNADLRTLDEIAREGRARAQAIIGTVRTA